MAGGMSAAALAGLPIRAATIAPQPIGRNERLARISRLQERLRQGGLGALIVEPGASLDYFTGVQWHRSERPTLAVIPAAGPPIVVTPFFERPSVAESLSVPAEIRVWQEDESPYAPVADYLRARAAGTRAVAVEETVRTFIVTGIGQAMPGVAVQDGAELVRGLRMIKSQAELALMQRANDLTIAALRRTHAEVRAGESNGDIGDRFERIVSELGGSDPWSLVLIDEASALPHGSGRPQQVKRGSVVLMDCGCAYRGYQADISRTFVWGARPTPEQRKVWGQVRQGQAIAMAAARVGAPAGSVDDAVRSQYERWGYGPRYALPGLSHRTGHGIGMEGHEPVNLVHGEATRLAPGMCFSNEPGIYLPGKFGIRLEDCFHMTAAGPVWFTRPPDSIDRPFG
ncbi:Xaa-Pro peptidase family protein [Sphingomonas sp. BN140010]|uniref:Xaa-Pro peptidase family protein n=1 Tax=Sphingomonas arvum TaxID=2992113 RepID=A0ABT3JJ43_9SPHN|nr:Xaa-Pro peptidase family protein [Sphingomonas sp. BN140010]MCW3798775.1 Xaa-Pro peptidase family protein [Sphingomonas sp. BN140010]